jgi:hypothetical protein
MHRLPDPHGNIARFIGISDGKPHDVDIPDGPIAHTGESHAMDRDHRKASAGFGYRSRALLT